jgi:phenylacetate-CoA ligase
LTYRRLDGGILGRVDELIHIRGNNVYPSALEAVLREFAEVAEYRIEVDETKTLTALRIEVEPMAGIDGVKLAERVAEAIRERLLFRAEVVAVVPGSLPRFELKAKRVVRKT